MNASAEDPEASSLLGMWGDYIATCAGLAEQLRTGAILSPGIGPFPFSNAWTQFAGALGMPLAPTRTSFQADTMFAQIAPPLGATREYQQITQRLLDLAANFQRVYARLVELGAEVAQHAQKHVQTTAPPGSTPSALYDAWVDGAEDAYAQIAHSDDFARLLGELCNILSSFRVERGKLLEAMARHLDLPSRDELDSLHRQVYELTRALRRLDTPQERPPPTRKPRKKRAGS